MANHATNLFFASTTNEKDRARIVRHLGENFDDWKYDVFDECVEGEFTSRWAYPAEIIEGMTALLEAEDNVYIRILTHDLANEYVSFRVFSKGKWRIEI